ncbi:hypothetical protein TNCV_402921 [Trichonephila clavipes]|nr:hypothetical protein TNCV_402921 [Trichonephila clavipes]
MYSARVVAQVNSVMEAVSLGFKQRIFTGPAKSIPVIEKEADSTNLSEDRGSSICFPHFALKSLQGRHLG